MVLDFCGKGQTSKDSTVCPPAHFIPDSVGPFEYHFDSISLRLSPGVHVFEMVFKYKSHEVTESWSLKLHEMLGFPKGHPN